MTKRKSLTQKLMALAEDELLKAVKKSIRTKKPEDPPRFKDDKVF
jgi:hypothetical protein